MNSVVLSASDRLRVRIWLSEDRRVHHGIDLQFADRESIRSLRLLASPPGPVFQHVEHLHTDYCGGQTVLLLGKLESAHWSAAIEADPHRETISFDVACRFQREPRYLGSPYSLLASFDRPRLPLPEIDLPAIDDGIRRTLEVDERYGRVSIQVLADAAPLPRTVRWKYVVSFPAG